MDTLIRMVCFDGAKTTGQALQKLKQRLRTIDDSVAETCSGPLLLLGYNGNASRSLIVRTEMTKAAQPLTSGALLLETLRCRWPTEDCPRPSWSPEVADKSTLSSTIGKLYDDVSKSNSDVVAIISNQLDCSNIVEAIAELAAAPYLRGPFEGMRQYLEEIGKIKVPEAFQEEAVRLYNCLYREKFNELLASFSKSGPATVVSPTKNLGKVGAICRIESLEPADIDMKDVNSGQSEQPSDLEGGCSGAYTRGLETLRACKETYKNQHLVVISIESTMSDIPDSGYSDLLAKLKYPIKLDFAVILKIDTAINEPQIDLTDVGSPFAAVLHRLRELCDANITNARFWQIFHGEVDPKNWQKQTSGDRYVDIVAACKRVRKTLAV